MVMTDRAGETTGHPVATATAGCRRAAVGSLLTTCALLVACSRGPAEPEANPLPALTSLAPSLIVVGQASADVTLSGTGFVNGSRARLDGADRPTTFVGSQELTMSLTAEDLALAGVHEVSVVSPPPGGGESGTVALAVGYPEPTVTSVSPLSADVGSAEITLTVEGTGFLDGASTVRFGNSNLATTFLSATLVTAIVPEERLAGPAFVDVHVSNPGPGGGPSNAVEFAVENPQPVVTSVSPTTIVGGTDTRISVVGRGFASSTQLVWGGTAYTTQVVSSSLLYADLPGSAFMTAGPFDIEVLTPPPGGGTSNAVQATVVDPPPVISGFTPASVEAGSAAFTLTVHGENFSASSEVLWDGVQRAVMFVDAATLDVDVSAADVAEPGSGMVTVREPGGGESHVVGFPIVPASPSLIDSMSITLSTTDLVTAPSGEVVYAAVPAGAPAYANELVALDPTTGAVSWHTPAGSGPARVVVSDDGAFVYVALSGASSISRIDVAARQKDLDITLPASLRAEDLLVVPGSPTTIAVSLRNTCCSPRHEGVAVYDGDVQRPVLTQGHTGSNRIEPAVGGQRLYGYNNETTEFGFRRILVTSDGPIQDGVYGGLVQGFGTDIVYDGGLIFSTRGEVIEPESRDVLGTLAGSGIMRPDVANGRVHFLSSGDLTAYHYATFTELGSVNVPSAIGLSVMVRFGTDGMAFGGGDRVLFIRSALIGS